MNHIKNNEAATYITNRLNFTNSNRTFTGKPDYHGTYTVYSYHLPIAWYENEEWHIEEGRYTQTTNRHLGIVRRALA